MRSVEELCAAVERGVVPKYLLFWGHRPRGDGTLGSGCLSQWWPAPFSVDGERFATAEHYMMWRKALLFGDFEAAERVLEVAHPAEAKKMGRLVRGFDQSIWEEARFDIVVAGSVAKFGSDAELRSYLVGTAGRVLVEASPMDRVWGIGLSAKDERAGDPTRWRGLNLLGFALMRAREELAG
ncbi:NADAR family protein [Nocardia coubleae]|uniref:NADAR family protein n=1 Tax=Nocardia coubleae TaxID=356147 RepID=UPI001FDFE760|nr:NADAR family protein [Nocardia coubleae]